MIKFSILRTAIYLRKQLPGSSGFLVLLLSLSLTTACQGGTSGSDPTVPSGSTGSSGDPPATVPNASEAAEAAALKSFKETSRNEAPEYDWSTIFHGHPIVYVQNPAPHQEVKKFTEVLRRNSNVVSSAFTSFSPDDKKRITGIKFGVNSNKYYAAKAIVSFSDDSARDFYFASDNKTCVNPPDDDQDAKCPTGGSNGQYFLFPYGITFLAKVDGETPFALTVGHSLSQKETFLRNFILATERNPYVTFKSDREATKGFLKEASSSLSPVNHHNDFDLTFHTGPIRADKADWEIDLEITKWSISDTFNSVMHSLDDGRDLKYTFDPREPFTLSIGGRYQNNTPSLKSGFISGQFYGYFSKIYASGVYSFKTIENKKDMEYWGVFTTDSGAPSEKAPSP